MSDRPSAPRIHDVVVIGGGAAGIGVGVALKHAGIENFVILERLMIGASFFLWPAETRFITPSFPTNAIGMLDLNAVALGTSPAFILGVEHPTGEEFAVHLNAVAKHYELPVRTKTEVLRVTKIGDDFRVDTPEETLRTKHVIWAAGEFQYPHLGGFKGSDLCRHTATLANYAELEGDDFIVIGGYESGVDAAYHLAARGKRVQLFDAGYPWDNESSDPSISLSTYSLERMRETPFTDHVRLVPKTPIVSVTHPEAHPGLGYEVTTLDGQRFRTPTPPLLATGFGSSHARVGDLFASRPDGYPLLTEHDESTRVPGVFLCGPAVRHDNHVFCFIYKFRQRFAVVAKAIATSLGLAAEGLERYRHWGMYLDDLSICGEECLC